MVSSVAERISVLEEQAKKIFEEIVPLWEQNVVETRFLSDEARQKYFYDICDKLANGHEAPDAVDTAIDQHPMTSGMGNMTDAEILSELYHCDADFQNSDFYAQFVATNLAALEFVGKLLAEQEDPIPY